MFDTLLAGLLAGLLTGLLAVSLTGDGGSGKPVLIS